MLFGKKKKPLSVYDVELHSHLLPGIDDGVETFEQSLEILRQWEAWGFKAAITTPHIMLDYYPNTPEIILGKLEELKMQAKEAGLAIQLEAAAEYYVDDLFLNYLKEGNELLSFGARKYVLFETSYINEPSFLNEAIFEISARGYRPVMAHPERYTYLYDQPQRVDSLAERVEFQVNLFSLIGYYSKAAKKLAERLIKTGNVTFLGSDCHKPRQLAAMEEALRSKPYQRLLSQGIVQNAALI